MQFVIVHHHFRPGGVRRVVELALPHLVQALQPRVTAVVLATGEAVDAFWLDRLRASLGALPVVVRVEPALGYVAESRLPLARRTGKLRRFFAEYCGDDAVVWAHNLSLGRNLVAGRELARLCARRKIALVLHHHDWWCDNRWHRWSEMRQAGGRSLAQVATAILSASTPVRHAALNQADAGILRRHLGRQAGWLPNLTDPTPRPSAQRQQQARRWLTTQLGDPAPVWLMPCRLLRRKNVAEALLLTRWLRPEAWLVTTGGISSAEEAAYARRLAEAARQADWKLCLGILSGNEGAKPAVPELLAASEAVLLTSLLEGFGLAYLEAAAAHRPLLARTLPNIAPDLARFGFRFPQSYGEILIAPSLFDWAEEMTRQHQRWHQWRQRLPRSCRPLAGVPALLATGGRPQPVPFSRLTLAAQLEVLRQPPRESWRLCAPLNPFLAGWRERAARGTLGVTHWPRDAARELEGSAYAERFARLLHARPVSALAATAGAKAQTDLIRRALRAENLYPLLWSTTG